MITDEATRLTEILSRNEDHRVGSRVVQLDRRPLLAPSSHRLEALDATLEDGTVLALVLKHLGRDGMLPNALVARPSFLADSWREAVVYTDVLSGDRLGTARCYGVLNAAGNSQALLLERIAGQDLSEVALPAWIAAARWLGRFHAALDARTRVLPRRLLRYDAAGWRRWMLRAESYASAADRRTLEWIASRHATAVDCLAALPLSVLHGDFHASNVLVVDEGERLRICPVDWELAGVGPGLLDLAALTAGEWTSEQRETLVAAYLEASGDLYAGSADIEHALAASRLQVAVQWLGWAPDWSPPAEHRQDWLAEAVRSAEAMAI